MTPDMMERVLRASALRRSGEGHYKATLRHLEAAATLRLMFDSALRVDDMVRVGWAHLSTDPASNGHRTLYVPPGKTPHDRYGNVSPPTWEALQRWRAATPDPTGRISTASNAQALGERIRRLGQFAGIPITGHSPRRGVATTLAQAGATEQELRAVGGWKSPQMVSEYVDAPHAAANAVTRLYPTDDDPAPASYTDSWARARADMAANAPAALAYFDKILDNSTALLPYIAGLSMAVALNADRTHPAVHHARYRILELWPTRDLPEDCARPDCPGMVLTLGARPDERWCSDRCRQIARNERRRAARKDQP